LTYAPIGKVVSFEGPGGKSSEIDATTLESTAKEFLIGLADEGSFSFELNLDTSDETHAALRDDRAARALRSFKLALADDATTTLTFDAYVMEYRLSGRADGIVKLNVGLRISGPVAYHHHES
jgi:hypothetical protein